jgi:hypothetical protein
MYHAALREKGRGEALVSRMCVTVYFRAMIRERRASALVVEIWTSSAVCSRTGSMMTQWDVRGQAIMYCQIWVVGS